MSQPQSHIGIVDVPLWATAPDVAPERSSSVPADSGHHRFGGSGSEPLEMKLFSDLWTDQTPDFDPCFPSEPQLPSGFPGTANRSPPSHHAAIGAINDIQAILWPPRTTGRGYQLVTLNCTLKSRLEDMQSVLHLFVKHGEWMVDSEQVVIFFLLPKNRSIYCATGCIHEGPGPILWTNVASLDQNLYHRHCVTTRKHFGRWKCLPP